MSRNTARIRRLLGRMAADFPTEAEALGRRAFWRLATRFTPYLAVDREGMRFLVSTADETIGRRLFVYHRTPELDIVEAFEALRSIPGLDERLRDVNVLEIGANIGSHTVELITRYGARSVLAIEPHPDNCELLRQNVLANGVAERVSLLEMALSDQDGSVELEVSGDNSGDHRVRVNGAGSGPRQPGRSAIEVRAARLDSLVEAGELALDEIGLVWMDAQGHEAHILRGATRLLSSDVPIMMEYWPYGLRRAGRARRAARADPRELLARGRRLAAPRPGPAADLAPTSCPSSRPNTAGPGDPEDPLPGTDLILMRGLGGSAQRRGFGYRPDRRNSPNVVLFLPRGRCSTQSARVVSRLLGGGEGGLESPAETADAPAVAAERPVESGSAWLPQERRHAEGRAGSAPGARRRR